MIKAGTKVRITNNFNNRCSIYEGQEFLTIDTPSDVTFSLSDSLRCIWINNPIEGIDYNPILLLNEEYEVIEESEKTD